MKKTMAIIVCAISLLGEAQNLDAFHSGKAIKSFGKIASVDADMTIPKGTKFNVSFDVGKQAKAGEINRTFDSAARFINMHVEAGVPLDDIHVAIVVHGSASSDLTHNQFYKRQHEGTENANVEAISALLENNTQLILCGQTAAYRGITKEDLVPGVQMALSAMTAHSLLLQEGYTPNPF